MRNWWMNLGLREKQYLSLGCLFVVFFIFYQCIWSPINAKKESLRNMISSETELLSWMEKTNLRIQRFEKLSHQNSPHSGSVLGLVQTAVNESAFVKNSTPLKIGQDNSVQLSLKNVEFDQLIKWLTGLWDKQGLVVKQITVTPNGNNGVVNADLTLN